MRITLVGDLAHLDRVKATDDKMHVGVIDTVYHGNYGFTCQVHDNEVFVFTQFDLDFGIVEVERL